MAMTEKPPRTRGVAFECYCTIAGDPRYIVYDPAALPEAIADLRANFPDVVEVVVGEHWSDRIWWGAEGLRRRRMRSV